MEQRPNPDDQSQPVTPGADDTPTTHPVGGETPDWATTPTGELPAVGSPSGPGAPRGHVDDLARARSSRGRRALAGAALATGLVVGGAAVAAAVTGPGENAAVQTVGSTNAHAGHGHGRAGVENMRIARALHGELTVPKAGGGTRVLLVQRGTVTSVSSSRLVVKSTDGFTATYQIASSTKVRTATGTTISGVKVGETVHVVAAKGGSALMVRAGRGMGHQGHDGRGAPDTTPPSTGTPAPSGSGSATGTGFDGGSGVAQL